MVNFFGRYREKLKHKNDYWNRLQEFISDGSLNDREKKELDELSKSLVLTKEELMPLHKKACSFLFSKITADQRITTEEKKNLEGITNYFGLTLNDFNFDQSDFNKFYALAQIDEGTIPTLQCDELDIVLKKGETLHWACVATLQKYKRITERVNWAGFTSSIKIVKGLRYRTGSLRVSTNSKEYLIPEDAGYFWMTNKRLGFRGRRKNIAVSYDKVSLFEANGDGLMIAKEGKEVPYIVALGDYDVPLSILSFILNR